MKKSWVEKRFDQERVNIVKLVLFEESEMQEGVKNTVEKMRKMAEQGYEAMQIGWR